MTHLAHVAHTHREAARAWLDRRLDTLCRDWGMDPEAVWRRPRFEARWTARLDAQAALMASVRDGARAAQGLPARDGRGRFVSTHQGDSDE